MIYPNVWYNFRLHGLVQCYRFYREVKVDVNKLPVAIFPLKQMRSYGNAAYSSLFNRRIQPRQITHFLEYFNKKLTFYQN